MKDDSSRDQLDEQARPIDSKDLLDRCMGSESVALTVLDRLEEQLEVVERNLSATPIENEQMARLAHSVRGAAGTVGARRLHATAARVEDAAKASPDAQAPLNDLLDEIRRCQAYIDSARREIGDAPPPPGDVDGTE